MKRIMYIERKDGLEGPGRIGWVEFSKSVRSFYYGGKRFEKTKSGYKYNCIEVETGDRYWISGPKKNGMDRLYGGVVEKMKMPVLRIGTKSGGFLVPLISRSTARNLRFKLRPSAILLPPDSSVRRPPRFDANILFPEVQARQGFFQTRALLVDKLASDWSRE